MNQLGISVANIIINSPLDKLFPLNMNLIQSIQYEAFFINVHPEEVNVHQLYYKIPKSCNAQCHASNIDNIKSYLAFNALKLHLRRRTSV